MTSRKVIVFGPTGAVGSAAARTAEELGAKVVLAMRDTTKPIRSLNAEKEKQGGFERVEADLTKPDTVRDAVTKTGAKYAFIYLAHGMSDHMKSTIEALKSAGIELVVFLSSFTIQGDPKNVPSDEVISYVHAQVEINLEEIFGANGYIAIRAGAFASNSSQFKSGFARGEVKIHRPEMLMDSIAPEDIGRVSGTILAKGPQDGNKIIYIYGPELLTQEENVKILGEVLGKNPKIQTATEQDAMRMMMEDRGVPEPLAKYMSTMTEKAPHGPDYVFGHQINKDDLLNVQKYTGKRATTFREWAEQNTDIFVS